jgi:hypothetical protein
MLRTRSAVEVRFRAFARAGEEPEGVEEVLKLRREGARRGCCLAATSVDGERTWAEEEPAGVGAADADGEGVDFAVGTAVGGTGGDEATIGTGANWRLVL